MKQESLNLSGKIDGNTVGALSLINTTAFELGINYFLIGATARDIILEKYYYLPVIRATLDVDLGIQVSNWDAFNRMKSDLIKTGHFSPTREIHRLRYENNKIIDLIPFGPIGGRNETIKWPPDGDSQMIIDGFEETYKTALNVIIQNSPKVEVKVVSLAGLAVLKLFSWNDRRYERNKDAADLALILRSYSDADNADRIFDELPDLLEREDFDYVAAGARLLGKDISRIFKKKTINKILAILENEVGERDQHRLIEDMIQSGMISGDNFSEMQKLIEEIKKGIGGNFS